MPQILRNNMSYAIGDTVICKVEVLQNGKKKMSIIEPAVSSKTEEMNFLIIGIDHSIDLYKIAIPEEMPGWVVSKFHVEFHHVNKQHIGKKFYDIPESLILGKVKKNK